MLGKLTDDNVGPGTFFAQRFQVVQIRQYNLSRRELGLDQFATLLAPGQDAVIVIWILDRQHRQQVAADVAADTCTVELSDLKK